ncbi:MULTISPECIES: TlpA family protein disulfide reductase [unclassified Sphingomonas]|uniref:TlpA family protein disulfide reductase n=1 Tax=unclassified Sphingomonas TaxID=196159 RepID=UPI00071363F5|nr:MULTISPECIES: hypothetical protein [unclassified Sphingomonas]KQM59935.1 hypothetical protein ASE65_09400 [Sphingomonas sp. Leaf16]
MKRWAGICGWAAALLLSATPVSAAPAYPARTILLFVASWCAPCHGEIAALPRLSEAAGPWRVLVVPVDRGRATAAMLQAVPAAQRWLPDAAQMAAMREDLFGGTAGLPFSVAVGGDGRPCGAHRGVLSAARVSALRAGCGG